MNHIEVSFEDRFDCLSNCRRAVKPVVRGHLKEKVPFITGSLTWER